jgi:hypothetical protein
MDETAQRHSTGRATQVGVLGLELGDAIGELFEAHPEIVGLGGTLDQLGAQLLRLGDTTEGGVGCGPAGEAVGRSLVVTRHARSMR